ncbi:MAG: Zn-dependent exopeptidase M28 [Verrucomicrobia bacterium]|nr:Zn-dependent exopeptidase M28 [Verrucomicrobiota bacterium]MCG2678503.1 M28 family metallopeptidase [Kiritimatiellia bacterium]MBU4248009.1 Zn-dependent exopeptidase M28 [Verrucomicrobiota bacterium]MBU4289553.1 Zn-dependent exopeptidase M28 [Verrucomicrobiota bacterium]MBU4427748.1 Zn-dependent exopeptidase M28 [Verrucomicrobiota bacterium]
MHSFPTPIATANLQRHLRILTRDIGVRLSGSPGEQQAADYLAAEFQKTGAKVTLETFPVMERWVKRQRLKIRLGKRWLVFPCSLISSTPGTEGKTLEAPLVFFEAPAEYQRGNLTHLRGKAVVHLGTHIESRESYRRLIRARPKFLLFVDIRYPGTTPLADGLFPAYTRDIGAVPTINVAFQDAWRWKAEGAAAARLNVVGGIRPATSQNVIAELPGTDSSAGLIFLSGHHDTQADSVGADDNASGSVALLELARVLAPLPRRRAIRLISFGAEEQLSVGSAMYVRRHRAELERAGKLIFNLDAFGSLMGWTVMVGNGPKSMSQAILPYFEQQGLSVKVSEEIMPYSDHFPFVAAGVPGIYLGRNNCTAGRFFHHRPDDDMRRLSIPLMAGLLNAVARMIAHFAAAKKMPFPADIPPEQRRHVRTFWQDLFGGF